MQLTSAYYDVLVRIYRVWFADELDLLIITHFGVGCYKNYMHLKICGYFFRVMSPLLQTVKVVSGSAISISFVWIISGYQPIMWELNMWRKPQPKKRYARIMDCPMIPVLRTIYLLQLFWNFSSFCPLHQDQFTHHFIIDFSDPILPFMDLYTYISRNVLSIFI